MSVTAEGHRALCNECQIFRAAGQREHSSTDKGVGVALECASAPVDSLLCTNIAATHTCKHYYNK